jgi:hypothetical protein
MNKIESARIIVATDGWCGDIKNCEGCCLQKECCGTVTKLNDLQRLALAKAYIKRHESKSKKKVEPKPSKTVGIDNSDVVLARPTVKENLSVPQPIKITLPEIFWCPLPDRIEIFDKAKVAKCIVDRSLQYNFETYIIIYVDGEKAYPCYATLAEAIEVGEKWWGGK